MTAVDASPEHSDIPFHGPASLEPLWRAFAAEYSSEGDAHLRSRGATLLDQLAFCNEGLKQIVAETTAASGEQRGIRYSLEHAALALAEASRQPTSRPLHRAVVNALVERWIVLERNAGLYPPVPLARESGGQWTDAEKQRIVDARRDLLRSPEGSLVAGALTMLCEPFIRAVAGKVSKQYNRRPDEVLSAARERFSSAMFSYSPGHGASFITFACYGLSKFLPGSVLKQDPPLRMREMLDSDDARHGWDDIVDDRASSSFAETIAREYLERLPGLLAQLPERHRTILTLRFGLGDGEQHTLDQAGAIFGVTRERARQMEKDAFALLAEAYAKDAARRTRSGIHH